MPTTITDEIMRELLAKARSYTFMILHKTAKYSEPDTPQVVREHGRRNFQLRADGILSIVCPATDAGDIAGIGIFNASLEETKRILDGDPCVQAGIFTYEAHSCRSFPGDVLPP